MQCETIKVDRTCYAQFQPPPDVTHAILHNAALNFWWQTAKRDGWTYERFLETCVTTLFSERETILRQLTIAELRRPIVIDGREFSLKFDPHEVQEKLVNPLRPETTAG